MTYRSERFQKQKPLLRRAALREKWGNYTFVSAYGSIFIFDFLLLLLLLLKGQSLTDCLRTSSTALAEFEGTTRREKLCGNYKPFTWHWHYTARITIPPPSENTDCQMCSPYRSPLQACIIQHLNQTYISIETLQNSFLHRAQRWCVSLYLHGSGREEKVGGRECTSLLFTPLSNW